MSKIIAMLAVSIIGGCAAIDSVECQTTDWYQLGRRDGRMNAWPQAETYAARCGSGVKVDAARYTEGWQQGFSERPAPPR